MNPSAKLAAAALLSLLTAPALAQLTLYEHDNFRGRGLDVVDGISNLKRAGFNDTVSSISIARGHWEVCDDAGFRGRCELLGPGNYPSMRNFKLNDRISSVRRVNRPAGLPPGGRPAGRPGHGGHYDDSYAYYPRPNERLFQAEVTSVRAVYERRDRRCWNESKVERRRDEPNVGGAVVGGIIGGILGHQVGDGSGQTAATIGGAVAGAALGSKAGRDRDHGRGYERGMARCDDRGRDQPDYFDVSYEFRGVEHWVRMNRPPRRTITVNGRGEPRE